MKKKFSEVPELPLRCNSCVARKRISPNWRSFHGEKNLKIAVELAEKLGHSGEHLVFI